MTGPSYENVFVFGDVHGDSIKLELLIAKARAIVPEVQLISVGDLIDRGATSKHVVDTCVREGVVGVLGNHELWFHQVCNLGVFSGYALQKIMGGSFTLRSYGVDPRVCEEDIGELLKEAIPASHKEFILGLPVHMKFTVGSQVYRVIHGGLKTAEGLEEMVNQGFPEDEMLQAVAGTRPDVLLWTGPSGLKGDGPTNLYQFRDGSVQILGHVPLNAPRDGGSFLALDTGCGTCPPYKLSGVMLSANPDLNRKFLSI